MIPETRFFRNHWFILLRSNDTVGWWIKSFRTSWNLSMFMVVFYLKSFGQEMSPNNAGNSFSPPLYIHVVNMHPSAHIIFLFNGFILLPSKNHFMNCKFGWYEWSKTYTTADKAAHVARDAIVSLPFGGGLESLHCQLDSALRQLEATAHGYFGGQWLWRLTHSMPALQLRQRESNLPQGWFAAAGKCAYGWMPPMAPVQTR